LNGDSITISSDLSSRDLGLSQALRREHRQPYASPRRHEIIRGGEDIADGTLDDVHGRANDFGWDNDEAYPHFEPLVDVSVTKNTKDSRTCFIPLMDTPIHINLDKSPRTKKTPKRSGALAPGEVQSKITPRRIPKKTRAKPAEQEDDETWEKFMKERIVQDRHLHLRILRYEVCIP
jgi:hypothetical protein